MNREMTLANEVDDLLQRAPAPERRNDPVADLRSEVLDYIGQMKNLRHMDPDEAMAWLSSVSARILEMIVATLDNDGRLVTRFRVEVLIPTRDELRYQFQIASRRQSVQQFEWDVATGQAT